MLTPTTLRADLKCGNGSISPGEKCTKGSATKANPVAQAGKRYRTASRTMERRYGKRPTTERVLNALGTGGVVGGLGYSAVQAFRGNEAEMFKGFSAAHAGGALNSAASLMAARRTRNRTGAYLAGARLASNAYLAGLHGAGGIALSRRVNRASQRGAYEQRYKQARENTRNYWGSSRSGSTGGGQRTASRSSYKGDPFRDLGVNPNASEADIKRAWKEAMRRNHPDMGGDPEAAKRTNAAYQEILRRMGRKDSIFADGFDIDWDAL